MRFIAALLLPVLFVLLFTAPTHAQKETEIINKLRTALQDAALDAPEPPLYGKGTFITGDVNFSGALYYAKPNLRMEMTFAGSTFIGVENDSLEWEYNPFNQQHTVRKRNIAASHARNEKDKILDFCSRPLLYYKKRKHTLVYKGEQQIDSIQAYVLELTLKDRNEPAMFYINKRTNLVYKSKLGGSVRWFTHYTSSGKFVYPRHLGQEDDGVEKMTMKFDVITVGKPIPDSLFIIPKEAIAGSHAHGTKLDRMVATADSLSNAGNLDAAAAKYNEVLKLDQNNYAAYNGRGVTRLRRKQYYEAIADFNLALEQNPSGKMAYNNRGLAKFYLNDKQGALTDYNQALKLDSTLALAYSNRGLMMYQSGEYEKAKADFVKNVNLRPDYADGHFKLGAALAMLERYEEALASYNKAAGLNYNTYELHNYRGVSQYKLEQYEAAAVSFRQAMKLNADNLQPIDNLGNTLYQLGRYAEAMEVYEVYLKKNTQNDAIYNMLGLCQYQEEDYKSAIISFTKALELAGKESQYAENRADAKQELEDYVGALADYTLAITLNGSNGQLFYKRGMVKIHTSKKLEGCADLATAYDMKYEGAKDAIMKNCN